jgi:hypothetical protein
MKKITTALQLILLTVIAAVAVFGVSAVVAGHWWEPPAPKVDVPALGMQIHSSIQNSLDTGESTKDLGLHVVGNTSYDTTLINVTGDGNEYYGMVHISTPRGTDRTLAFTVYADPNGAWIYNPDATDWLRIVTTAQQESA